MDVESLHNAAEAVFAGRVYEGQPLPIIGPNNLGYVAIAPSDALFIVELLGTETK